MKARLHPKVMLRRETFGGMAYVSHRDDFFALDRRSFAVVEGLRTEFMDAKSEYVDAFAQLAIEPRIEYR